MDKEPDIIIGTPFCKKHYCVMVCLDRVSFECPECNINISEGEKKQ